MPSAAPRGGRRYRLAARRLVHGPRNACRSSAHPVASGRLRSCRSRASDVPMDLCQRGRDRKLGLYVSGIGAWLDASPIADLAMTFMREATGRADPVEPLRPTGPAALTKGCRVAFWSLVGGVGSSTVAALVAHRSAAGGRAPLL